MTNFLWEIFMANKKGTTHSKHSKKSGRISLLRIGVMLLFLLLFVVVGSMLINQERTQQRVQQKAKELADMERIAQAEYEQIQKLKERAESDEFIEEIAREQLGLVNTQETVYHTGD